MSDDIETLLEERPDRLQLIRWADIVKRTAAPWLVRGVLRVRSLIQIYGPPGGYKSFVALDIAASLGAAIPWHDAPVVTPGLVIYVAAEGGGGMVTRTRAWSEQHNLHPTRINVLFVVEPVTITATSEDMDILVHRIQEAIHFIPEGTHDEEYGYHDCDSAREWPVLIIIDTLARCYLGDENKTEDMGQFVQGLGRLQREFNSSVLVVHHSGRDESHERGNTALRGACDTIYRIDANRDDQTLKISCEKMKDSKEPEDRILVYREVSVSRREDDDPLDEMTSIVLDSEEGDSTDKEERALNVLAENGPLSWANWFGLTGMPKATFNRVIVRLRKSGLIIKEKSDWRVV